MSSKIEIANNGIESIIDCLKSKINKNNISSFNNLFEQVYSLLTSSDQRLTSKDFFNLTNYLESISIFEKIPMKGDEIKMYTTAGYKLLKIIGQGGYGITLLIQIKNKKCVMKIPIMNRDDSLQNNQKVISNFMEEIITHLLLECFHLKMEQYLQLKFEQPFPKIISVSKGTIPRRSARISENELEANVISEIPIYVMEPLEINLFEYIKDILPKYPEHEQVYEISSIFLQIASNLHLLQKSVNFMHRDFHAKNVMLKKDTSNFSVIYELNNTPIFIQRKFRTYIIDFGQCCAKLYNCCDIPVPIFGTSEEDSLYPEDICDFNSAQDLRYLFGFIYLELKDFLPIPIQKYIRGIIEPYFPNIENDLQNGFIEEPHHFFYSQVIKVSDPNFSPVNVIEDLLTLIGYRKNFLVPESSPTYSSSTVVQEKQSCTIL